MASDKAKKWAEDFCRSAIREVMDRFVKLNRPEQVQPFRGPKGELRFEIHKKRSGKCPA